MPRVAEARVGQRLRVRGRALPFSYFPVGRGGRRKAVYDLLFATSPWAVMSGRISQELNDDEERAEALAFLDQARQFYATAGSYQSANPLLYYYAFLNLAKPLIRLRGYEGSLEKASHGLYNERIGKAGTPGDFQVTIEGPHQNKINMFAELSARLGSGTPPSGPRTVEELMSQVVVGHRLWRQAATARERFVGLDRVELRQNLAASEMWLRLLVRREDFGRFGRSHKEVRKCGGLATDFHEVAGGDIPTDRVAFEQLSPVNYGQRPNDHLDGLVDGIRDRLWRIVSADPEQGSLNRPGLDTSTVAHLSQLGGLVCDDGRKPQPADLAVTAGWASVQSREQKSGAISRIVMPSSGRVVRRETGHGERPMLSSAQRGLLGEEVVDVYLNATTCWRGIPEAVWNFKIGGFQVLRKWLSYRDETVLGRAITREEARQFQSIARRLTELVLLTSDLDANYRAATGSVDQESLIDFTFEKG